MTDKQPIDYAPVDSADVVRKKFRRRVFWFGALTVVVVLIGVGWINSNNARARSSFINYAIKPLSVQSNQGWIILYQRPPNPSASAPLAIGRYYGNDVVGVRISRFNGPGFPNWVVAVRYRTLFILAMIPWIIILIRLIRIWKLKTPAG